MTELSKAITGLAVFAENFELSRLATNQPTSLHLKQFRLQVFGNNFCQTTTKAMFDNETHSEQVDLRKQNRENSVDSLERSRVSLS